MSIVIIIYINYTTMLYIITINLTTLFSVFTLCSLKQEPFKLQNVKGITMYLIKLL